MVTPHTAADNLRLAGRLMSGPIASSFGGRDQRHNLGSLDQEILQPIVDFVETLAQAFKI